MGATGDYCGSGASPVGVGDFDESFGVIWIEYSFALGTGVKLPGEIMAFKKAVKSEAKLRLAINGASGSGKTFTSLAIGSGLGKKVAFVDTEHGSASKYADVFEFDVMELVAPYHPQKYIDAIKDAVADGYDVIILDSLTHAWSGTGGILEIVDDIAKRNKSGNSFAAWKDATQIQNKLIETILSAQLHIIATVRSKQDYVQSEENGKKVIKKMGMAPVQREGLEYEFDIVLDMDSDNTAVVSKSRCPALSGAVLRKPGGDVAKTLADWLHGAKPAPGNAEPGQAPQGPQQEVDFYPPDGEQLFGRETEPAPPRASREQQNQFHAIGTKIYGAGPAWDAARHKLVEEITTGATTSSNDLTPGECNELMLTMLGKAAFGDEWSAKAEALCKAANVVSLRQLPPATVKTSLTKLQKQLEGAPVAVGK